MAVLLPINKLHRSVLVSYLLRLNIFTVSQDRHSSFGSPNQSNYVGTLVLVRPLPFQAIALRYRYSNMTCYVDTAKNASIRTHARTHARTHTRTHTHRIHAHTHAHTTHAHTHRIRQSNSKQTTWEQPRSKLWFDLGSEQGLPQTS